MRYLLSAGVVFAPGGDELGEVVGAEDGGVPGQVVETVNNTTKFKFKIFTAFDRNLFRTKDDL